MNIEQEKAARDFENARATVAKALTTNNGGKRAEAVYGNAYQALVTVGLATQLRSKYRP